MNAHSAEKDAGLTDLQRDAMIRAVIEPDDSCAHNFANVFALVDAILVERQAQAWQQGNETVPGYYNPYRRVTSPGVGA